MCVSIYLGSGSYNLGMRFIATMYWYLKCLVFAAGYGWSKLLFWWTLPAHLFQCEHLSHVTLWLQFFVFQCSKFKLKGASICFQMHDPQGVSNWSVTHVDWSEAKWHPKSYRAQDISYELLKNITVWLCFSLFCINPYFQFITWYCRYSVLDIDPKLAIRCFLPRQFFQRK